MNLNGVTVDTGGPKGPVAIPTGFFVQDGRFQQNQFSVVPEIGLTIGYQFTDRLRTFVGYNFIYWSKVVRPGDQISPMVNPAVPALPFGGPGAIGPAQGFAFHTSSFWAEGITFGIEWRY